MNLRCCFLCLLFFFFLEAFLVFYLQEHAGAGRRSHDHVLMKHRGLVEGKFHRDQLKDRTEGLREVQQEVNEDDELSQPAALVLQLMGSSKDANGLRNLQVNGSVPQTEAPLGLVLSVFSLCEVQNPKPAVCHVHHICTSVQTHEDDEEADRPHPLMPQEPAHPHTRHNRKNQVPCDMDETTTRRRKRSKRMVRIMMMTWVFLFIYYQCFFLPLM